MRYRWVKVAAACPPADGLPQESKRVIEPEQGELEVARVRILRLDAALLGITTGLIVGLGIFAATNWLVLKGGPVVGPNLALLAQFCPGYTVTFLGSLIGFVWGVIYGGVAGYLLARIYNHLVGRRGG